MDDDFPFDSDPFQDDLATCQFAIDRFVRQPTDRRMTAVIDALAAYQDSFITRSAEALFEDEDEDVA